MSNYTFDQITKIAAMYGNALNVKFRIRETKTADRWHYWAWAYIDLKEIILGPGFWKLTRLGQIRALIHEILHIKYPPTRSTTGRKRQIGVHAGLWKEWVDCFGKGVHWIEKYDILLEWRIHPYAKIPLYVGNTYSNA